MKKMRILSFILVVSLLLSVCACSSTKDNSVPQNNKPDIQQSDAQQSNTHEAVDINTGIETYFANIADSVTMDEYEWYRGMISSYTTGNTGKSKATPKGTFVYASNGNIQGAYPPQNQQENVWSFNVYETLFQRNSTTGEIEPWLATDYYYDEAGNFHITLRENVKFHDGNTMTAEDVLFTLKLSHDDSKARAYRDMQKIDFDSCVIEDDYHLTLAFIEPIGSILDILASGYLGIMSKKFVESVGEDYAYMDASGGTGPYYLVETVTDLSQTFKAFDGYWGERASIDTIIYKKYTDQTVMFIDYLNGDLDLAFRLLYEDACSIVDGTYSDTTLFRIPNSRYKYVYFNTNNKTSPMSNRLVREAFASCLNYSEIVYAVYGSTAMSGPQMSSVFMPGLSYKADIGSYEYDPVRAVQLLEEAGYSESNPCVLKIITTADNHNDTIAELMQGYCTEVGITLEIDIVKSSALKDQKDGLLETSAYDILLTAGDFGNGSPTGLLSGADAYGLDVGMFNPLKGVVNEEVHKLYSQAETTQDEAERAECYKQIQQIFYDNVYSMALLPDATMVAAHSWINNVVFRSGLTLDFTSLSMTE